MKLIMMRNIFGLTKFLLHGVGPLARIIDGVCYLSHGVAVGYTDLPLSGEKVLLNCVPANILVNKKHV